MAQRKTFGAEYGYPNAYHTRYGTIGVNSFALKNLATAPIMLFGGLGLTADYLLPGLLQVPLVDISLSVILVLSIIPWVSLFIGGEALLVKLFPLQCLAFEEKSGIGIFESR